MLLPYYQSKLIEAGTDEAGRGCLAGPVFAAAVILPKDFKNKELNDSKKLSRKQREELRTIVEREAIAFAVSSIDNLKIDEINILNASMLAMHSSLDALKAKFQFIIVDGNKFKPYKLVGDNTNKGEIIVPHQTIVKGDGKYLSIAAASVLAKTYRDDFMEAQHALYPEYDWLSNKGYGVEKHRKAILEFGHSPLHRKSFVLKEMQMELF